MNSPRDPLTRFCACGCGGQPVGGEFLPGHDAKLRGKYLDRIDDGEERAINEFLEAGPRLAYPYGYTEANLRARLGQARRRRRTVSMVMRSVPASTSQRRRVSSRQ